MFQMDLVRRKTAGRLSEVLGKKTLSIDVWNRHLDFERTAGKILQALSEKQRQILHNYVSGINAYLNTVTILPVEFLVLGYSPETWREEDSILVSLGMYQMLNTDESDERMISVMKKSHLLLSIK